MTRASSHGGEHEHVGDELAELALGVIAGERRTGALEHCDGCATCRRDLAELSRGLDALLLAAPLREPPAGFESRTLAAMLPDQRHRSARLRRLRRALVAIALLVAAAALGAGAAHAFAPPVAARTAALKVAGRGTGEVVVTGERPALLVVTLAGGRWPSWVSCEVVTTAGKHLALGPYAVGPKGGTWSAHLEVSGASLTRVALVGTDGSMLASAPLRP